MKELSEYIYDHSKRMWYRHRSACCHAPLVQKMLHKGKVTPPGFKLGSSKTVRAPSGRRWWQFWKTKYKMRPITVYREVRFCYYCSKCDKQNNGQWDFVYDKGVPEGQRSISKIERVGSSPATPAK